MRATVASLRGGTGKPGSPSLSAGGRALSYHAPEPPPSDHPAAPRNRRPRRTVTDGRDQPKSMAYACRNMHITCILASTSDLVYDLGIVFSFLRSPKPPAGRALLLCIEFSRHSHSAIRNPTFCPSPLRSFSAFSAFSAVNPPPPYPLFPIHPLPLFSVVLSNLLSVFIRVHPW